MRTHSITTPLDESCDPVGWSAASVDPTGWLAGAGSTSTERQTKADPAEATASIERAAVRPARRSAGERRRARARTNRARRSVIVERTGGGQSLQRPADVDERRSAERPSDHRSSEGYRMGRWARLTLTLTVLAAVAVVTVSLVVGSVGSTSRPMIDVTVGPGDTLWSIAVQAAPDRDPRDVIEEIRTLNDVPVSVLPVGIVLRVPSSGG